MKQDETTVLMPKLRFPEFRETNGWEIKLIGPYLEDCSGRVPPETNLPVYSSTREGLKRQDAYFDGRVLQNKSEYGVVPPGCFVYRHMSDDGLFKFNINDTGGAIAVSKEYPVFRTKGLNSTFLLAKLNDGLDFKHFAFSQKAGGTRTRLYFSRLCQWHTLLPSLAEQYKIADCLSSLDELIAAQAQKVEALKSHKKGLMQRLFPREGETQPPFRFPEFQDSGDWADSPMGKLLMRPPSYGVNAAAVPFSEDLPQYLRITDISEDGHYLPEKRVSVNLQAADQNYLEEGDVVLARTGASVGKSYKYRKEDGRLVFAGFLIRVKPHPKKLVSAYLANYLKTGSFWNWVAVASARSGQPGINSTQYSSLSIPLPPTLAEQQHIASCLSSFDAKITAETQKLEAFKTHKMGLMQQLFPSAEVER
jgi:type I restriction enzyme S subunit